MKHILITALVSFLLSSNAFAGNKNKGAFFALGIGNKAFGDIVRERVPCDGCRQHTLTFAVKEAVRTRGRILRKASGVAFAEEIGTDAHWEIDAKCVDVVGNSQAYFGGPVRPGGFHPEGTYLMLRVDDGGSPGAGNDRVWMGDTTDTAEFKEFCSASPADRDTFIPREWIAVSGDLSVRKSYRGWRRLLRRFYRRYRHGDDY